MKCRICGSNTDKNRFKVRELMFDTRAEFNYFQCEVCECLQIEELPSNIEKYYPQDYYSFEAPQGFKNFLKQMRTNHLLGKKNFLGRVLSQVAGAPNYVEWLKRADVTEQSEILDVGCGGGELLKKIMGFRFKKLMGVDPYISETFFIDGQVEVKKAELENIDGQFDLIMLHHSMEHMWDQHKTVREVRRLLKDKGTLLIRVPLVSSNAWTKYGVHWVQLDAPRHFYLHSKKSIEVLLKENGFLIEKVVYDSDAFQFWGSEQYKNGIPLRGDLRSYAENKNTELFSRDQLAEYSQLAKELNEKELGDQAAFYVKKI